MKIGEIEVIDVEQGSLEWFEVRRGLPTASNFSDVMASGRDGGISKTRDLLLRKLAGEIVSGVNREDFRNGAMDRGNAMEDEVRSLYAMIAGVQPTKVGFVRRAMRYGIIGASPDSFVGADRGVEIKTAAPHILIEILKADRVPPEHVIQIQGSMMVSGRKSWDLAIGYTGMPLFRKTVRRDEATIARLDLALSVFYEELDELVAWLRRYGKG
ncbi:MAG: YqaJ viral recombinase family protein [Xanthobacteraceae bacterium]|nr:YqaJ viral recombinase family protein [Xanthobacteraceae bacterium]